MTKEDAVWSALEDVKDPELGAGIVDLGLVYEVGVDERGKASIRMTLTIPECPLADEIVKEVKETAGAVPGIADVEVELVWEPKWTPANMNDIAREQVRAHLQAMH